MNISVTLRRSFGVVATAVVCAMATPTMAASESVALDSFPTEKMSDLPALQDGARTFVNYCLSCHSASSYRFNRLQDIGLTDEQILGSLVFTGGRVGDTMDVAMRPDDAKVWFGAAPPDLSVIARARSSHDGTGADWLYTFFRSFYRDASRPTGWNNSIFPNVGMPHILGQWQGNRGATEEAVAPVTDDESGEITGWTKTTVIFDEHGNRTENVEQLTGDNHHETTSMHLDKPVGGTMTQAEYDDKVANLVAFLNYMGDPTASTRSSLGIWVLLFLAILILSARWLNREYWKYVK
ncbi:MAG: cytochrome c1 [Lautropia sp.]|nr:cytochrome c1 [Lautropia sp.]